MDAPESTSAPAPVHPKPAQRPRRRWPRRVAGVLVILGLFLLTVVALLPTLAGTGSGRRLAESQVNQRIPGSVSIDGLTARWFGGQRLEGVALRDPDGVEVLTLATLDLPDAGLWALVRGSRELGAASVAGVRLDVVKDADGRTNLEKALGSGGAAEHAAEAETPGTSDDAGGGLPADLGLNLTLTDVVVSYRERGVEPPRAPLGAALATGRVTLAGGALEAEFDSAVSVGDDAGRVSGGLDGGSNTAADPRWTGTVTAVDLPLAALDAWIGADGYLKAALGDAAGFTVALDAWSPDLGGGIVVGADTAAGTGGTVKLIDDGTTLRLAEPATFSLVQTPELSDKVTRLVNPVLMPAVVSANRPLTVTLDPAGFAIGSRGFDWSAINATLRLDVGTVSVLTTREPFAGLAQQLQALGVLRKASLYDLEVRPIELSIVEGVFRYLPQHFKLDDVTLTFDGLLSMTDRVLDVRLVPGGREIDRDPLIKSLAAGGVHISGTLDQPKVELGSLADALSKERLPDTLVNVLGGLLERELRKNDRPSRGGAEEAAP